MRFAAALLRGRMEACTRLEYAVRLQLKSFWACSLLIHLQVYWQSNCWERWRAWRKPKQTQGAKSSIVKKQFVMNRFNFKTRCNLQTTINELECGGFEPKHIIQQSMPCYRTACASNQRAVDRVHWRRGTSNHKRDHPIESTWRLVFCGMSSTTENFVCVPCYWNIL